MRSISGPLSTLRACVALVALLAGMPAAAEQPLDNATKDVRAIVTRLADAPVGQADVQKELRAALAELDSSTSAVRSWLAKNESAAVIFATDTPKIPPWGVEHRYAAAWNDLLTLARRHGAAPGTTRYLVKERKPAFWNLTVAFPVSSRWHIEYPSDDQRSAVITQKNGSGTVIRSLTFYRYRWNTTYSGVGGENAQKLAEVLWKLDREIYAERARDASRSVEIRALNKSIPRSYYYFARGPDPADQRDKRTRNWYFKGRRNTFCVEVVEELEASLSKTELDRAQQAEGDPEVALLLDSISISER